MNITQDVPHANPINPDVILGLRWFVTHDDDLFETVAEAIISIDHARQRFAATLYDDKHNTVARLTYVPGPWNGWQKEEISNA